MNKQIVLVRLAQTFMTLTAAWFFVWLGWQNLVPFGVFTTVWNPGKTSAFIDRLLPDSRVSLSRTIVDDPVFFFAHPHRRFDTVEAEILFKNNGANIVEFGALASSNPEVYTLLPLENRLLDECVWDKMKNDGLTLYQRVKKYESVDAFLQNPPNISRVAVYHASVAVPAPDPALLSAPRDVSLGLRGTHEMKFATGDGSLTLEMTYAQDAANTKPLTIALSGQNGNIIASRAYTLETSDTLPRMIRFDVPNVTKGIYKLSWQAPENIVWISLKSRLTKVVFLNHISTVDAMRVSVDAPEFALKTTVADGLQTATVNDRPIRITEPAAPVSVRSVTLGETLDLSRGSVAIDGIGWYAVVPFMLFRPDPIRLQATTDFDAQGIDYVLAKYDPPAVDGDWKMARASFDATKIWRENRTWKFVFSAPKIKEQNASVEIGEIRMMWKRSSLFPELSK